MIGMRDREIVIQTESLSKRYGRVLALDGLSLDVRAGEVLGFLGPNGAGKTTTLRLLMGYLRPTGAVSVLAAMAVLLVAGGILFARRDLS